MNKRIQILTVMLCLGLLVALGGLTTVQAASIAINFPGNAADDTRTLTPTDVAGFVPQANWNNAPANQTAGTVSTIMNSTGATVAGASLTWTAPNGGYGVGAQAGVPVDGDNKMYVGYVEGNLATGAHFTITGLPAGTYDVFVYTNRDGVAADTDGQVTIGAASYYFHPIVGWTGAFVRATQTTAPGTIGTSPVANFCRFTGVSGGTVTIDALTIGGAQKGTAVCGIQFVPSSEIQASGTITSPTGNPRLKMGDAVTMSANVTVTGTTVTRVDFLVNGLVAGSDTTATGNAYSFDWLVSPASPGSAYCVAKIYTFGGQVYNTEGVPFTVKTDFDVTDLGDPLSGTVSASAEAWSAARGAFDNNLNTGWDSGSGDPGWIQFHLLTPQSINAYGFYNWESIWSNGTGDEDPKDIDLKASNNGTDWVTLDSQRGLLPSLNDIAGTLAANPYMLFNLPAKVGPYSYYRLEVLANHAAYGSQGVVELSFLDIPIGTVNMVDPVGTVYKPRQALPLTANCSGFAAAITHVYFFSSVALLGEGTAAGAGNYTLDWTPQDFGIYNIVALAKTADGTVMPSVNSSTVIVPVFVTPAGGGTGANWSDALTLDSAVSKVNLIPGGLALFLKEGTYDVGTTLTLKSPSTLYGGFAGTETDPGERTGDPFTAHVSKLDGGGTHQILTINGAATFDRVNFARGYSGGNGGAIRVNSMFTMNFCSFTDCHAAGRGGAMYLGAYTCTIADCLFKNNTADAAFNHADYTGGGGAIFIRGNPGPTINRCTFEGNTATNGDGGAIVFSGTSPLGSFDCVFKSNSAPNGRGGATYQDGNGTQAAYRCVFSSNSANQGGAVGGCGPAPYGDYITRFYNNVFWKNNATDNGGAMYVPQTYALRFACNTIVANTCGTGDTDGVFLGGRGYTPCFVIDCLFQGHTKLALNMPNGWPSAFDCLNNLFVARVPGGVNDFAITGFTDTGTLNTSGNNFVDAANGNLDLIASAPAKDAGVTNGVVTTWFSIPDASRYLDLDYKRRLRPAQGTSDLPDIGAAEFAVMGTLTASPSPVIYGTQLVGTVVTLPLSLTATGGNSPITVTTATITGTGASAFRIISPSFSPANPIKLVPGGAATNVMVRFTAPATTDKISCPATISFTSDASNNPVTANLLGVSTVSLYPGSAPTVQITTTSPTPTHSFPIVFNVDFSEGVTGFTFSDIQWLGSIGGPSMTASIVPRGVTGANYSIVITDLPGVPSGTIQPSIPAGVAKSMTERANVGPVNGPTVSYDTTLLGVSILTGDGPVTDLTTVTYTLTFTQQVTDLPKTLLAPTGTSAGATLGDLTTNNSTAWTLIVNTGGDGTLGVALTDDDSIVSVVGAKKLNGTGDATLYGNMIDVEKTSPTLLSIQRAFGVKRGTADPVIIFQVTFSQPVTNVTPSDFQVTASGTGFAPTGVTVLNGTAYVSCTTGTAIGPFSLSVKDNKTITNAKGLKYVPGTADPNEDYYILTVTPGETAAQTWSLY